MKKIIAKQAICFLILPFVISCGGSSPSSKAKSEESGGSLTVPSETPPVDPELFDGERKAGEGELLSSQLIQTRTVEDIKTLIEDMGVPSFLAGLIDELSFHDVEVYRVTYQTVYVDGSLIEASGAVLVPKGLNEATLVNYTHGTIYPDEKNVIPSNGSGDELEGMALISALGYYMILPDYIGYGASQDFPHPYVNAKIHARTSYNMLVASRQLLNQLGQKVRPEFFLMGYSQGAQAGMALQRQLQEEPLAELKVKASSFGSGPYDRLEVLKGALQGNLEEVNKVMTWALESVNWETTLRRSRASLYNPPYDKIIGDAFAQNLLPENLPDDPREVFREDLINGIVNGSDSVLLAAFEKDKETYDWRAEAPMWLYHGFGDELVPISSSDKAIESLRAKGSEVRLRTTEDQTHRGGVTRYIIMSLAVILPDRVGLDADTILDVIGF